MADEAEETWSRFMHYITREKYLAQMKGAPLSIYHALLTRTNFNFKAVMPGIGLLVTETGYEERQIRRGIKTLEKLGLIHTVKKRNQYGHH